MNAHSHMILDQYKENLESYETIKNVTLDTLQKLIAKDGMMVNAVEGRVKTEKSLIGKLELKGDKYSCIDDITDIVGCRVITFYPSEVDKIAAFLEKYFSIDWENSVDKRKLMDPDRFGYMSLHYVCRIPKKLYFDAKHPEINEIRFEIQMRTALQHVWATAYHDTGYKSDIEVPTEYIRALSRLAGVLEIADEQFDKILGDLNEYRRKVKSLVKDGQFNDLNLNGDSFSSYMETLPFKSLNRKIASINKAEIQVNDSSRYLSVFRQLGFKTLADVEKMKADYSQEAYQMAALQLSGTDIDIISSTIGLQNLCLVYILKNGGGEMELKKFFDCLYGEKERNSNSAKRIINQAKSINVI